VNALKVTETLTCGGILKKTPVPCDRPSCLHVCRGVAHENTGCPECTWSAECIPDGCQCTVCTPNKGKEIDTRFRT
jgi:hypothetical protein